LISDDKLAVYGVARSAYAMAVVPSASRFLNFLLPSTLITHNRKWKRVEIFLALKFRVLVFTIGYIVISAATRRFVEVPPLRVGMNSWKTKNSHVSKSSDKREAAWHRPATDQGHRTQDTGHSRPWGPWTPNAERPHLSSLYSTTSSSSTLHGPRERARCHDVTSKHKAQQPATTDHWGGGANQFTRRGMRWNLESDGEWRVYVNSFLASGATFPEATSETWLLNAHSYPFRTYCCVDKTHHKS